MTQEIIVLIAVSFAALLVTLFIIKRVIRLLYFIALAVLAFFPGFAFGGHISAYLTEFINNRLLLNLTSYTISFLAFYIVLVFFMNFITKKAK